MSFEQHESLQSAAEQVNAGRMTRRSFLGRAATLSIRKQRGTGAP